MTKLCNCVQIGKIGNNPDVTGQLEVKNLASDSFSSGIIKAMTTFISQSKIRGSGLSKSLSGPLFAMLCRAQMVYHQKTNND